jgi:hypothetical protein
MWHYSLCHHYPICFPLFSYPDAVFTTSKVEYPITGHLRSCTKKVKCINYGIFLGYKEIRVEKDFYFFIIFCQKLKLI